MDEKKPKKTLTDFIEQNQKLLSTVGIFTALSVFINQLPGELAKSDAGLHAILRALSCFLCALAICRNETLFKRSICLTAVQLVIWRRYANRRFVPSG
jgi:hypothetical protein